MYYVMPVNDKFHAGIALASQGGSGLDYGDNFSGQSLLKNIEFMTVQLMPSVSYKVNDKLAIGASINVEYLTIDAELDTLPTSGFLAAEADDLTVGYSLSAFYKFNEQHRIGMLYRSEIGHYGEGTGTTTSTPSVSLDVGLDLIMPAHMQVSGVHNVVPKWDMLWSVTWYDLSTWTDLIIDVDTGLGGGGLPIVERNFDDVWNFAIGTHYQLNEQWRLEAGISYETSPQDNAENQYMDLPVGETKRIGFGATYQMNEQWQLKGYYDYIDLGSPDINYSGLAAVQGSYDNSAHFFGLQVNFKFK